MNIYLERKLTRHAELCADADAITNRAAEENRDITQDEAAAYRGMVNEATTLEAEIAPLRELEARQRAMADARAELAPTQRTDDRDVVRGGQLERYRGRVGDYLADWGNQRRDPMAAQRIARAHAEYRVVADQKLADNPGIVPVPIVGPVEGTLPELRPVIDSVTPRPMPAGGATFNRPKITQHSSVAAQAGEKTQLSSQKLVIDSVPVTKQTFGGTLDISFQDRDWTDPAILAIAVADLAAVYARETDNAAADGLKAATTNNFVLADGAAEGLIRAAFLNASSAIFAATGKWPDTVWMSTDDYAMYAATTTSNGGPAFPLLADASGAGGTMLGLKVVVDANFAAKTTIIGASSAVEHYETVGGLLSVTEPTILGYTIAYYGYVADLLVDVNAARKRSLT